MFEGARFNSARLDERVDVILFESDHPAEPVGHELVFIDEAVQRAGSDTEAFGGLGGTQPSQVIRCHAASVARSHILSTPSVCLASRH